MNGPIFVIVVKLSNFDQLDRLLKMDNLSFILRMRQKWAPWQNRLSNVQSVTPERLYNIDHFFKDTGRKFHFMIQTNRTRKDDNKIFICDS